MRYDSLLVRYNELLLNHVNYQKGIEASQKAFELSDQNTKDFIRVAEIDNKVIRRTNQVVWQKVKAPVLGMALFYLGNRSVSWNLVLIAKNKSFSSADNSAQNFDSNIKDREKDISSKPKKLIAKCTP
jgi:hypothetical protein